MPSKTVFAPPISVAAGSSAVPGRPSAPKVRYIRRASAPLASVT
jgi:hypothetical protein